MSKKASKAPKEGGPIEPGEWLVVEGDRPEIVVSGTVKLEVIAPQGAYIYGVGSRDRGGHFELPAITAHELVKSYPGVFRLEGGNDNAS